NPQGGAPVNQATAAAQSAEAFEEVPPGEIEQTLERQRGQGDGTVSRASVANLVVVTPTRAAGQRALAAVEELGARAPSRCVVLIAEPPEGRQGVRSWARVVNRRPDQGPELVWEEVVVQTNVHPRHLTAVVLPLLLPELPVFTWWQGTPPFDQEVFTELTSVTDRLIVDSAAFADPVADLRRLAGGVGGVEPAAPAGARPWTGRAGCGSTRSSPRPGWSWSAGSPPGWAGSRRRSPRPARSWPWPTAPPAEAARPGWWRP